MFLEIKNLTKSFGGIRAVDCCSFEVKEGELLGLIGPNGSGKTTTFNLITAMLKPDSGKILFKGKNITGLKTYQIARLGIGRTFQLIKMFPRLRVIDNVMIARRFVIGEKFWPQFYSKRVSAEEEDNKKRCLELLKLVNLDAKQNDLAENLSYGQQKLLEIARAMATEPDLLLLDEPFAGVNPTLTKQIIEVIKKLNRKGKTIIIVEHNMNIMMNLCKRLVVLDYGKEIAQGSPAHIKKNKKVIEAYLGVKKA